MTILQDSKRVWINQLVDAGFSLFPLLAGTKVPTESGTEWQYTPYDPMLSLEDFPDNYGVVLPEDVFVLDVDVKNFAPKSNPWADLLCDLGLPADYNFETYTVRSRKYSDKPVDGLHIYFRKPKGINIRSYSKRYGTGLEGCSVGRYVVGPGSKHPESKSEYIVVRGDPSKLQDIPPALLAQFERENYQTDRSPVESDSEDAIGRYIDFLKVREPAYQSQGGDNWTYKTAAKGRDYGLSEVVVFDLMRDIWNPDCEPPWGDAALAEKVKNAFKYTQDVPGNATAESAFAGKDIPDLTPLQKQVEQEVKDRLTAESNAGIYWSGKMNSEGVYVYLDKTINNVKNHFVVGHHGTYKNPLHGIVRLNTFNHTIELEHPAPWHQPNENRKVWSNEDTVALRAWFSRVRRWDPNEKDIFDAVVSYAYDRRYHPIQEYFQSLEWDGEERLDTFLPYYTGCEENIYTCAAGRCTLIALIARIMQPGCQHDHVLVLEGDQGVGKSTFCRILGGEWYADVHLDPRNKDTVMNLIGAAVVELSEMTHTTLADTAATKAFISKTEDRIRKPYGRIAESIPRQCILIGTINPGPMGDYLRDQTGNRRFWPIETRHFRNDELKRDREQLFAEAYHLWKAGEPWWFTNKRVENMALAAAESRTEQDSFVETILNWFKKEAEVGREYPELATTEIVERALNLSASKVDRFISTRVATAMKKLGWWHVQIVASDGHKRRGWKNPNYYDMIESMVEDL